MLVLSRKVDESVQIGDHITVTVLKVKGNTVRIGIDAPKSVRVVRGELEAKLDSSPSQKEASQGGSKNEPSKGGLALSDLAKDGLSKSDRNHSPTIIEFTNHDRPEVRTERFGDNCETSVGNDRSDNCHQLPLSRFTKPDYQVGHFCISIDEKAEK